MSGKVELGLKENLKQFILLVLVNGFVGGMVGMERSILPEFASTYFSLNATIALLSFIVVFGFSKAIANYFTGRLFNKWGRKNVLILGWIIALPVPLLILYAPNWAWVGVANMFLGVSQGLTWTSTVIMKIDLVGPKKRGLAMGINESMGYLAVGITAFVTSWLASEYGLKPYPFYLGLGFAIAGLLISILFVKDTGHFVQLESKESIVKPIKNVFLTTTFKDRNLSSITQAGLINNLNDGMLWGLLPILLMSYNFSLVDAGKIIAIYPLVWGAGQLFTGPLSDKFNVKGILYFGMLIQAISIAGIIGSDLFWQQALAGVGMGIGTALVYPTFLAAISKEVQPSQRAEVVGVFRFWRDSGYAIGALITGILVDLTSLNETIWIVSGLTALSALIIRFRMTDKSQLH